jgi:pimeloyl-ACP methyl ester carboxylesterase
VKVLDKKFPLSSVVSSGITELIPIHSTSTLLNHTNYKRNQPTIVYAHGYTASYATEDSQAIANAYSQRRDHNILLLDWSVYSSGRYLLQAVPNAYRFGEFLGRTLLKMSAEGFNLNNFHLIGQSLGGQMIGIAGRSVIRNSIGTQKLTRITALDPAGPAFYGFGSRFSQPLSRNDGKRVNDIEQFTRRSKFDFDFSCFCRRDSLRLDVLRSSLSHRNGRLLAKLREDSARMSSWWLGHQKS